MAFLSSLDPQLVAGYIDAKCYPLKLVTPAELCNQAAHQPLAGPAASTAHCVYARCPAQRLH
jgi:hypothetical protein